MTKPPSSRITKETLTNADWYKIACKIRQQNEELKAEISHLKQVLSSQKQKINEQVIALETKDTLIQKKDTIINNLNAEYSKQKSNNLDEKQQQLVVENLTQELQKVQEQAAKLERECSFLQDKYNQQEHLLKQKETENKELQIRLQRQQRYNLQYKSALDQYLHSDPNGDEIVQNNLPEHQTIQPWNSAQNNLEIPKKLQYLAPKISNNLTDILTEKNSKIQINQEDDIPEIIYDDNSSSTEAKIDSLIQEIEQEMESMINKASESDIYKKLDLPVVNQDDSQSNKTEQNKSNPTTKSDDDTNADQQNNNKPKRFLKLPKFGN